MPAANTLPFVTSPTLTLPTSMMRITSAIMIISMVSDIVTPSGRNCGWKPNNTTKATPKRKTQTEYLASGRAIVSACRKLSVSFSGQISPSLTRR